MSVAASVGAMANAQEIRISVSVATGDPVALGDTVVLLESMTMEVPVMAEYAGTVGDIFVTPGDVVQEGDVLLSIRA